VKAVDVTLYMKNIISLRCGLYLGSLSLGFLSTSGCVVEPNGRVGLLAPSVELAPVVVSTSAAVPDYYAWDGYENVGLVGDEYFYLGVDNVWLPADSARLARFHGWAGSHSDWRNHATRNSNFRKGAGHAQPRRNVKH